MSDYVTVRVGPKHRMVLPALLRDEAGVTVGSDLVGHVDPLGRLVFETPASARARVWAAAPAVEGDSQVEVRLARAADVEAEQVAAARRDEQPRDGSAGERLLAELGL